MNDLNFDLKVMWLYYSYKHAIIVDKFNFKKLNGGGLFEISTACHAMVLLNIVTGL